MTTGQLVKSGHRIRVLVDNLHQEIYTLPDFLGNDPDEDVLLRELVKSIRDKEGPRDITIGGDSPDRVLFKVDAKAWSDTTYRKKVIEEIRAKNKHTGLGDDFYDYTNYYKEEAVKCYRRHRSPDLAVGCIDYMSPSKVLGNPLIDQDDLGDLTGDQRRDLMGMRRQVALCHFCPYHELVRVQRLSS